MILGNFLKILKELIDFENMVVLCYFVYCLVYIEWCVGKINNIIFRYFVYFGIFVCLVVDVEINYR